MGYRQTKNTRLLEFGNPLRVKSLVKSLVKSPTSIDSEPDSELDVINFSVNLFIY